MSNRRPWLLTGLIAAAVSLVGVLIAVGVLVQGDRTAPTATPSAVSGSASLFAATMRGLGDLTCVSEQSAPPVDGCYQFTADRGRSQIRWQGDTDDRLRGVSAELSTRDADATQVMLAGIATGLSMTSAQHAALLDAVAEAVESGQAREFDLDWGGVHVEHTGSVLQVYLERYDPSPEVTAERIFAGSAGDVRALLLASGYECEEVTDHQSVECATDGASVQTFGQGEALETLTLTGVDEELAARLVGEVAGDQRGTLVALLSGRTEEASVQARDGWVCLHDGDWTSIGTGAW